jgi:hypothetical protein
MFHDYRRVSKFQALLDPFANTTLTFNDNSHFERPAMSGTFHGYSFHSTNSALLPLARSQCDSELLVTCYSAARAAIAQQAATPAIENLSHGSARLAVLGVCAASEVAESAESSDLEHITQVKVDSIIDILCKTFKKQIDKKGISYDMHDKMLDNLSWTTFCVAASTSSFVHALATLTLT